MTLSLQTRFSVTTVTAWAPPMCAMGRTTVEMTQMKGTVQVSTSSIMSVSIMEGIVTNPYICSIFYLGAYVLFIIVQAHEEQIAPQPYHPSSPFIF